MRSLRPLPLVAAVLGVAIGASGCGNSTGPNTVTMTQAEVSEVFMEISAAMGQAGLLADRMPSGILAPARAAANASASQPVNVSATCSGGGTVAVSGSVSTSGTTGASFDLTETATSCETVHFTVGGSLKITGSVTLTSSTASFNENVKGSFSITRKSDQSTGNCAVDFTINGTSTSVTVSGTICGVNASGVVTA